MALKSDGSVLIETLFNTDGFDKGMKNIQGQMGGLGKAIGKLGLAIGAAFAVGKLVQFGKEAIELGSDLQEVQNVVDVTFTTMNEQVNEFARNAAETAGLSETMAKRYTGTFGAMAKAFGFAEGEAFNMSTSLTQLAGDVASFYNITQDEAYTKLKSVFTGETESLKDLGVVMTQNVLDAYAMAEGYGMTTAQMTEQQKVALRYKFVLDQLSSASGDFERTSDSWANQTRILQLNVESLKANIGQGLINIFTPILQVINKIIAKLAELSAYFVAFSELISGKSGGGGSGSPREALEDISDGYEDIGKSTNAAAKAQNKYLSGLDEIRTFSESNESGVDGGSSGIDLGNLNFDTDEGTNDSLTKSNELIQQLREKLEGLIQRFPILGNLANIVRGSFQLLSKVGWDLFTILTKPITDNKDGILQAAKNIGLFVLGILETVVAGFDEFIQKLNQVYDEHIAPVIDDITEDFSQLVEDFLGWFNEDMAPVLERWGDKFDEVWEEHIQPMLDNFAEFFGEIGDAIGNIWNNKIQPFLDWCVNTLLPVLTPVFENIGNAVLDMVGVIADVISVLIDILGGVITFTLGSFTGDWETAWNGIKDILGGVINLLVLAVQEGLNYIVGLINNMINGVNSISSAIGLGEIPLIPEFDFKLPFLATGAVIPPNAPFMAVLGDQRHGTNIEAPLDTIKQAVREVVGNSGGGGSYQFTAQINRRTLFDEMIEEGKLRQDIYGYNPFDLKGARA